MSKKILLVDDHEIVREGLRQILNGRLEIAEIDEASDYQEVCDMVFKTKYDLIILDMYNSGISSARAKLSPIL